MMSPPVLTTRSRFGLQEGISKKKTRTGRKGAETELEQITCVLVHSDSPERETVGQAHDVAARSDCPQALWASGGHKQEKTRTGRKGAQIDLEQITCVLVHPDSAEREAVGLTLEAAGMRIVAVCADWPQALNAVSRVRPAVVFVHALTPGLDAEQASSQLDARRLCRRPALVYLVPSYLPETMTRGMEPRLPASPDAEAVRACLTRVLPLPVRAEDVRRAERLLTHLDLAPGENRQRLAYAAALVLNDADNAHKLKSVVYPSVAAHFRTTPRRAEDSMRRAIDAAWTLGNIERQYALFGNTIDDTRGKPTTAALLATVAEFLRNGEDPETEPSRDTC